MNSYSSRVKQTVGFNNVIYTLNVKNQGLFVTWHGNQTDFGAAIDTLEGRVIVFYGA